MPERENLPNKGHAMLFKRLLLAATIAAFSNLALADGSMAAQALFSNLALAKKKLRVSEKDAMISLTLVRGMYRVDDQKGAFVTYVNEDGTLYGDENGLYAFPKHGAAPRRMTPEQLGAFRLELVNAIDRDSLIMVVYGNGGDRRKTVLFSDRDCSACLQLQNHLEKTSYNGVFFVVPSPQATVEGEDLAKWVAVANVWCASGSDKGQFWRDHMANRPVPRSRQCAVSDPRVAQKAWLDLHSILHNAGLSVSGAPGFVFDDGTFTTGLMGAAKVPASVKIASNWLRHAQTPHMPSVRTVDAFRPQTIQVARR